MSLLARSAGWRALGRVGRSAQLRASSYGLLLVAGILTYLGDVQSGHGARYSLGDAGATMGGAWAGAESGATAGAIIGSFIGPEGTIVGGFVGGLIGGVVGGVAGSGVFKAVSSWFGL